MYQLVFSNQTNLLLQPNQKHLEGIYPIRWNDNGDIRICIRQGRALIGYKYVRTTATWLNQWHETIFNKQGNYPLDRYPWLVADKLLPDMDVIILRHPNGIRFYQPDLTKPGLKLLKEDGHFHDTYGYTLLWGRFYPDTDWMGVMTRDIRGEVKFYAATRDSFLPDESNPLFPLEDKGLSFAAVWYSASTDFFLTNLRHHGAAVIGLRTTTGLEFYQFNANYLLDRIVNTSRIIKPLQGKSTQDHLFFADLTHQVYQDILHLNNSGLFVYQYNNNQQDYILLHHHAEFTQSYGWLPRYNNSIQLVDLNSDDRDDLLFTGPHGLTALTFDSTAAIWKTLLKSDQLNGMQRYAMIVGTLPAMPPTILQPSIFIQDAEGKVQWAQVIPSSNSAQPEDHRIPVTTVSPVKGQPLSTHKIPLHNNTLIPEQIARAALPEKPILRWTERWEDNFLKDTVDIASGQVRFNVPLVDISVSTGLGVQLALFYHSQAASAELLGVGWSLPLAQDYIIVDDRGSIYPENAHYYLLIQGRSHHLQALTTEGEIRRFQLAEQPQLTIEYHQSAQRWIVEYATEQAVYGRANHAAATDGLRWSLAWPNWRGCGRDKAQLQPLVITWYLNARLAKHHQQALYYHYEISNTTLPDGKTYTAAVRLKTISDSQQMRLVLDYELKNTPEYTTPNPIDNEGNIVFPVPLTENHYLQRCSITTILYQQTLQFVYQMDNDKRLLTGIQQQLLAHHEPLLQFSYQRLLEKQVLKSCTLPRGSTVEFNYETLTPPVAMIAHNNILRYPIREKPQVTYGSDYAVMAYRDLNPVAGKIILRVMNRKMTQTIIDCSVDANLLCPSEKSTIKDFTLQSYHNLFVVSLQSDQNRKLYLFERREQTWSAKPTEYNFTKEALVRFSKTVIAVAEPKANNLKLFALTDNQSRYNTTILSVPKALTRLVLHEGLVVGYDDDQLWKFYRDSQNRWRSYVLAPNLARARQTSLCLDLTSDAQQELLTILNQNGLKIFNNLIVLSTVHENGGHISSNVHLFLLDAQYSIAQTKLFTISRENILSLTYDYKDRNSVFQVHYVQDGGYFKLKIKNISGDVIKDIKESIEKDKSIRNRNHKEDAIKEQIKKRIEQISQQENWQKLFRTDYLINLSLYSIQISQQGVYCGNDILLRITGTGWQRESLPTVQWIRLGQHFILESTNTSRLLYKLYAQDQHQRKQGQVLRELVLHSPSQFIIQYPAYLAYESKPHSIEVLTFKNDQTLGQIHTFNDEYLLHESDRQNLITIANASTITMVHAEPQEYLVRPLSTLISSQPQRFVNQVKLTAGNLQRLTSYQRSFNIDQQEKINSEVIALIPAANKTLSGWYEETRSYNVNSGNVTKTQRYFDANGKAVLTPPEEKNSTEEATAASASSKISLTQLWDRSGQWLISDFSPYNLADEMVAYYGFESYENNQIGAPIANSSIPSKAWRFNGTQVINGGFAFTGENYLKLNHSRETNPAFLERVFQPRDQTITYLAACWLRCSAQLTLNTPMPYLKAILSTTSGHEFIGLLAQAKQQSGDWFYLELPIDFQLMKEIYQTYFIHTTTSANNSSITALPSPEVTRFRITLRMETKSEQTIDLDHIRFSPLNHDFKATIYHPLTGKPTAVTQANGLVIRTLYNRLHEEIASLQEDDQLEHFTSVSKTGRLVPQPQGSLPTHKPGRLTFQPEYGFYETFDGYALRSRWKLDNPVAWRIAPGQLWHRQPEKHRIEADPRLFNDAAAAIRFYFALQTSQASLSLNWKGVGSFQFTRQSNNFTTLTLPTAHSIKLLPSASELIIMLEQNYAWLWLDGVLILDQALPISRTETTSLNPWSSFALEAQGQLLIEDCLVMNRPQLKIEYYNAWGEKTQVIQLEDAQTTQVTEILYDSLGRAAITTKTTRIYRNRGQPLLAYRPNFVSNVDPTNQQSVWHTGRLDGEVDELNLDDQGVAYGRTEYARNPLNEEQVVGLPGRDFSITGRYATKLSRDSNIAFLSNHFPASQGYRQEVEYAPNGSQRVSIFDRYNNQVARYVRVPGYNHLLSTYEYNTENRLIKILPPLYHEKVNTADKLTFWQPGEQHLSAQEKQWQQALGTHFSYDANGNLIRKITPDSGTVEYLYNSAGQMRFMISLNVTNQTNQVVYFDYDARGQLSRTGHLREMLSTVALQQHLDSQNLSNAQDYQLFDYANDHLDPQLRGRIKHCITFNTDNQNEAVADKIHFNTQQQIIAKSTVTMSGQVETNQLTEFKKQYVDGKVYTLVYPITVNGQPLSLIHQYNRLGQLIKLGTPDNPTHYASFTYHAIGQLASEHYQPNESYNFTRNYRYNSPGFLEQIADPFLTEQITYTEKGYGQAGYGDGMIMRAAFNASWPANADRRWFQLREDAFNSNYSTTCINALKRTAYLAANGQPSKLYIREVETALPLVCGGKTGQLLAKLVAEKQMPRYYGHRYAYGNHQELVKAKYFTDETETLMEPLQPDSFTKEIPSLTHQQSQHIWQLLINASYIIADQRGVDLATAIGKRGKSVFRDADLRVDLAALNSNYILYLEPIERFIIAIISQRRRLSLAEFKETFLHWQNIDHTSSKLKYNWQQGIAQQIGQMLLDKGYLPTQTLDTALILEKNFTIILNDYSRFIPEIVRVLSQHFAHALGETAFDVESYEIDANGNHRHFYTGFNRYEFVYHNTTNQIQSVKLDWSTPFETEEVFSMQHDAQGNVIQALHKGIQCIEYHPVSQRTTRIQLTDGRTLHFYYDAQGERVLKQVLTAEGEISHETYYLRDEQGRVLVDRYTSYLPTPIQQIVTAYLYGPRGLLGFIRNDTFYSVTTDHAGSIRLVIRAGQVVAAYDYLPYGQLMRSFGNDPQAHIMYRYTGQEWDEETGLYNYHARFYDPSIGRFYQPDPKAQYFSPYKYAGNSPVSLIDPDGEEAITLIVTAIIGALVGAYLGGAAANNRWNPADWDFKDPGTWLGIFGGALAGSLLPLGFGTSTAFIANLVPAKLAAWSTLIGMGTTFALGAGGSYLMTAGANRNWNPAKWQWDRPHTWNALFQGFSAGSGIVGGVGVAHKFVSKVFGASSIGKTIFLTASYSAGGAMAYGAGVMANEGKFAFWQWDWTNPTTWSALVDGFDSGMGWPQGFTEIARGFGKLVKNPSKLKNLFGKHTASKTEAFMSIMKNSKHPLYKIVGSLVIVYYMGSSANNEFDITRWNLASFSTYEGVLNGVFFGKDTSSMLKLARATKTKQPTNALVPVPVNKINRWSTKFHHLLDDMQTFLKKIAYQRLMEESFSQDTMWRSKLQELENQPTSLMKDIENFFKRGLEMWRKGESQPPEALQKLIRKQAEQCIRSSSSKLIEWQAEAEQFSQKRREIFTDRDAKFLSCRAAKRKKRGAGGSTSRSCMIRNSIEEFKKDPTEFFSKYAVTTKKISFLVKANSNSLIQEFVFKKIGTDSYALAFAQDGDSNTIRGYWLPTSIAGDSKTGKIKINPFGDVRFTFTAELQGCSIYVKFDTTENTMELLHYNRPDLESIYINSYQGHPIEKNNENFFVDGIGRSINIGDPNNKKILDVKELKNKDGQPIVAEDGVIIIDQDLYYDDSNNNLQKIEKINGTPIEDIIKKNQEFLEKERVLAKEYDIVIRWEDYLGHPKNYALLQLYRKLPLTYATPFLYRDDNHRWHFTSQKITYDALTSAENFRLHNNELHRVSIPTIEKIVPSPLPAFTQPNRIRQFASELPRLNLRRKKSLNYVKSHIDDLTNPNTSELLNTKSCVNQLNTSYKEELQNHCLNIQHNGSDIVSSSSSRLQFWPIHLVKRTGTAILSLLTTSWISTSTVVPSTESLHHLSQSEPLVKHQAPIKSSETGPTLLEMGDKWLKNTDMNGNLMWSVLLARKWTGYRPTEPNILSHDPKINIELNIYAATLVDEFMDIVLTHAQACGIRSSTSDILEDITLYLEMIQLVCQKLAREQVETIPQLLLTKLVQQHINQIASTSTQAQANKLLIRITKDLPKLQQQFLQQVHEWVSLDR